MDLTSELVLSGIGNPGIADLSFPPGDDPPRMTLIFKALLTLEVAKALDCEWVFADGNLPHSSIKDIRLNNEFAMLTLMAEAGEEKLALIPESLYRFRVTPVGDGTLQLQFRADSVGSYDDWLAFLRKHRNDSYVFTLQPRQRELFDAGAGGTLVEIGGTRQIDADALPESTVALKVEPLAEGDRIPF